MKKLFVILCLPVLLFSCNRLEENEFGTSLAEDNLKGKVQSVKLTIYNASKKFDEVKPGTLCDKAYKHPLAFGYYFEWNGYFQGAICKRVYNENGMLLTEKWYDEEKELRAETSNTYKEGLLAESKSEHIYSFIPNSSYRTVYSYDETTKRLKEKTLYYDTNQPVVVRFEYTDSSRTTKNDHGATVTFYQNERPVRMVTYDSIGKEEGVSNFNNQGFKVSYSGKKSEEYKYNEYNDPVSLTEDIDSYVFTYEYDEKMNWIKRITYKDGEALYIEVREITYFDE